jgi:penicillin-binding protein 1A
VERGTAAGIRRGCPAGGPAAAQGVSDAPALCAHTLAGKTGTTNDYFDAWFMGFSPDLVVGIYVGFDNPRSMGNGEAGGTVAAPIFGDFMNTALKDQPIIPFRAPSGIRFVNIDSKTGELPGASSGVVIQEAFRKGSEPGFDTQFDDDNFNIAGSPGSGYTAPDYGPSILTDENGNPLLDENGLPIERPLTPNLPANTRPVEDFDGEVY